MGPTRRILATYDGAFSPRELLSSGNERLRAMDVRYVGGKNLWADPVCDAASDFGFGCQFSERVLRPVRRVRWRQRWDFWVDWGVRGRLVAIARPNVRNGAP